MAFFVELLSESRADEERSRMHAALESQDAPSWPAWLTT
jgi:hypothetical protein